MKWSATALAALLFLGGACTSAPSPGEIPQREGGESPTPSEGLTLATWNLDNFSEAGENEPRAQAIANEMTALDADLIAVQELKVPVPADGSLLDAYSTLDALLPDHAGIHAPWDESDTTVGILYRTDRLELKSSKTLFPDDWFAFPRPPLQATFRTIPEDFEFTVIVLHLKAFQDGEDRRRDACLKLDAYIRAQPVTQHIILGDFNDDPNDADHSNVFLDTFLADPDFYDFTAVDLAPSSVTSTGWYHYVGGEKIKGQFIDHILLTQPITDAWDRGSPTIHGVAEEDFEAWIAYSSDHFPVRLELTPAP